MHGGPDKVVYAYPSEHYEYWHAELPSVGFPWDVFGENFTTEGLLESAVYIGDQLRIGSAEFIVTQPSMPCFKLGMHFDRPDMVKRFLRSRRTGFYLRVSKEGDVAASPSDARVAVRNFRRSRSVMCHPLAEKRPIGRTDRVLRSIAGCKRSSRWSVDPAAADNAIIVVKDDRLAWRDG